MTVSVALKAKDSISPVVSKVNASLSKFENKAKSIRNTSTKIGAVSTAGLTALTAVVGSVVNKYQDLAKAQGEIKSLGLSANDIKAITTEAKAFSNTFAGTTQADFVRASYDIKSGISSLSAVGVAKFTALAALTGKATKSTTTQMTSFFATGYGIYAKQFDALSAKTVTGWKSLSQEEKDIKFGEYFAAGIAGAVKEFKTNGSQMQAAIENLGATATSSNVPFAEQLAILGTLQRTMSGSEAATKYRAFLNAAAGAQKKLKLNLLDSNNQLKSTPEILETLRKKYGDTLDDMEKQELKKAFGTDEALAYITALYDETGNLRNAQQRLSQTMKSGTKDVLTMAQAMNEGREFELLAQKANNLVSSIGEKFAPMAIAAAEYIGEITTSIDAWMTANDGAVDAIVAVVTAGGGMLATFAAISLSVSALAFAFSPLSKVVKGVMWLFSKFSKKGRMANKAVKALGVGLDAVAGKSVMAQLGVQMPKKPSLIAKFKNVLSILSRFALAHPIALVAAVTGAAAIGAYSVYKYQQEHQGEASLNKDAHTISQAKKEEEANVPKALRTKSMDEAIAAKARQKSWDDTKAKGLKMGFGLVSDIRKLNIRPTTKTVEKNIHVEAPIQITVNAVNGKAPTKEIGSMVQNHIKKAV